MTENWENFRGAVRVLVGPGAVKQRLASAYLDHLRGIDGDDLPGDVQVTFLELQSALACVRPAGGMHAAEAAIRKMSEQEAGAHAERVLAMLLAIVSDGDVAAQAAASPRLRVVGDDDLPAFLSRA